LILGATHGIWDVEGGSTDAGEEGGEFGGGLEASENSRRGEGGREMVSSRSILFRPNEGLDSSTSFDQISLHIHAFHVVVVEEGRSKEERP